MSSIAPGNCSKTKIAMKWWIKDNKPGLSYTVILGSWLTTSYVYTIDYGYFGLVFNAYDKINGKFVQKPAVYLTNSSFQNNSERYLACV